MTSTESCLIVAWEWLRANDLPNWVIFGFTAIVWPIVLFYWNRRRVNSITNLEVSLATAQIQINDNPHIAVDLVFLNNTGSVVYLSNVRVNRCTDSFPVSSDVRRDIAQNSHDLSFMDKNGGYVHPQSTLQTSGTAKTSVAVTQQLSGAFYQHKAPWYRRWFGIPKYFVLEYTAMVGTKRYSVATVY